MTQLKRSKEAEADLDELLTYGLMRLGEPAGTEYFFNFEEAWTLLTRHPEAGSPVDEIRPGLRKLTHCKHRIFYVFAGDVVRVARVLHHAMDVTGRL